jgi:putative spermidine/putrescine transport system permease protein
MTDSKRIWLSLAPALAVTIFLTFAGVAYAIAQSLGYLSLAGASQFSLAAYRNLFALHEFWVALGFSLWVSLTATILSSLCALLLGLGLSRRTSQATSTFALNWNLAFPHMVWAVGLLLVLSQSGLLSRWATALGFIGQPTEFPVLVRSRWGIGIILSYLTKEIPFLTLIVLAVLRSQTEGYTVVAENLGASWWQRLRWVILPMVLPALTSGALLVFAYVFGAYEVPALLGVRFPRMLSVLGLDFFLNPDLHSRAEGMAIGVILAVIILLAAGAGQIIRRSQDRGS